MDEDLKAALESGASTKIPQLAKALSLSSGALYNAVKAGKVRSVRIGGSVRIPNAEAKRLLGLTEAA